MLKYDQILELMLISVFSDAVVQVSFLATYEEVCGLPRSDPGQEIVSTPKKKPRETRLH
jgi:hypothetical protein